MDPDDQGFDDPRFDPAPISDAHLWRDREPVSDLEMLELIETMRKLVRHHMVAPYTVDTHSVRAREASWILMTAIRGKPVRDPAEVAAQWFVCQELAKKGAAPRRLVKTLAPSIDWLDPTDATSLAIRTQFARWMVACGGNMSRIGPRRGLEVLREVTATLLGHPVSVFRPARAWQEAGDACRELIAWAGPLRAPADRYDTHADPRQSKAAIAREATVMLARLHLDQGDRDHAVAEMGRVHQILQEMAEAGDLTEADEMMRTDLELDLMFLGEEDQGHP